VVASGEYKNISFVHEVVDRVVDDITDEILAEAALPEIAADGADLQASRLDHARDLRKHERTNVTGFSCGNANAAAVGGNRR